MSTVRTPHRFSVARYEQMIESGLLTENDRVELIHGVVVDKMTIRDEHAAVVRRLVEFFIETFGRRVTVGIQDPIRLADSVPEPDVMLLLRREDYYVSGTARPSDVLLLFEVADTTLDYDRNVKLPLYAENGVAEYWIVNLIDRCLEVYRQPRADGTYQESWTLRRGDRVGVLALLGDELEVSSLM